MGFRHVVLVAGIVAAGAIAWCWPRARPQLTAPLPDLVAVAKALWASDDKWFGNAELEALRAASAKIDTLEPAAQVDLRMKLGWQSLRLGEVDAAITTFETALAQARNVPRFATQLPRFHYWRGLAWMRKAELENCVADHHAACCIWPLEGAGVHESREPATTALAAYLDYLAMVPGDLGVQWLANVAAMAAGVHPAGVPASFRMVLNAPAGAAPVRRFLDRAPALGVDVLNLAGGAVVADVDGDGFLDLVTSTCDPDGKMTLFHSRGDGSFEDRSQASGLACQLGGLNCIQADYDGDGDVDLLVLRGAWLLEHGRIRRSLLRNDGTGRFEDVTAAAGLAQPAFPSQAAVWGDFDGDGDIDLFVGNESRREVGPHPGGEFPSQLFRNEGNGTFADVAAAAGVTNDRYCKGVTAGDYDNDGDLDLYVSNIGANRLYRNDGGMHFTDVAPQLGVTEPVGRSFACWFFDYDNDGWLDLFVAAYQATLAEVAADLQRTYCAASVPGGGQLPRLYHNVGGQFTDVTRVVGLDRVCLPMGANFGDVDGDGYLDIYLGTGEPGYEMVTPNILLWNDGGRRFVDVTIAAGLGHLQKGHGVAFGDLDHDGDQDLFHQLGGFYPGDRYHNALFENPGHGGHWVTLELAGTRSNRAAVGARVEVKVTTPRGPRVLHRAVGTVSSFGGSTLRQEIGLGDATAVQSVKVGWPRGMVQTFRDVPMDAFVEVREGDQGVRRLTRPRFSLAGATR